MRASAAGARKSRQAGPIRSSLRLLRQLQIKRVQLLYLITDGTHVAIVFDDVMCRFETRSPGCLDIEDGARLLEGGAVAGLQSANLQFLVAVYDEHSIQLRPQAFLNQ